MARGNYLATDWNGVQFIITISQSGRVTIQPDQLLRKEQKRHVIDAIQVFRPGADVNQLDDGSFAFALNAQPPADAHRLIAFVLRARFPSATFQQP